jgi:putative Ca2+/H+ antiporter (TMEM165/GDT1 family)
VDAFFLSTAVIFVAELGDKSQLMALAFASRYRLLPVLAGITIATLIVHAGSVLLGSVVAVALPTNLIAIVAGLAFFVFAAWTLRGDSLNDDEASRARRSAGSAIFAVAVAFFWPSWATRPCSLPSPWRLPRSRSAPGWGRPPEWCWPMRLPSPSAPS